MSEAIQIKGDDLQLGHFQLTPTGLVVRGTPKFEEWETCGAVLQRPKVRFSFGSATG